MSCCHTQRGSENKVTFVFSCPGRYEKIANAPAAKVTGANLSKLLEKLSLALNRNDLTREKITITNAWDKVEYKNCTGRSEAIDSEICEPKNIKRVKLTIQHTEDFIVCCGEKAQLAVQSCNLNSKVKQVFIQHLSTRSLIQIKKDINGENISSAESLRLDGTGRTLKKIQADNTSRRLEVVCKSIIDQLEIEIQPPT